MFVELERREIAGRDGPRFALVVHPRTRIRLGFDRVQMLEVTNGDASVDLEIVAMVDGVRTPGAVLVFRGRSDDGRGSWGLDERASDASAADLGYRLMRAQLPTFRRLLGLGIVGIVHTDITSRDATAMTGGAARLAGELVAGGAAHETDAAIVRDLVVTTDRPLSQVIASDLAEWIARMDVAWAKLKVP